MKYMKSPNATDAEMKELQLTELNKIIENRQLQWQGHLIKKNDAILKTKVTGKMKVGRKKSATKI